MSEQIENDINNEDILKIQNEIDNLEQKLFSDTNANISLDTFNSVSTTNNINSIQKNEKLNEKSFKFNNNLYKISEKIKNDNIKIIENEDIENEDVDEESKKNGKIKELIELQKEIDKLRKEKGKKIEKRLNKIYSNNNNKKPKNKFKHTDKK